MSPTSARHPGRPSVLIIDDTPTNLDVIAETLESHGFRMMVAQDGSEGLKRATLIRPDLILLDVMMPGLDGFEVCRRLKALESTRDIPVIFMTALTAIEDKVTGFGVGGVDYVTKPLQLDEVMARVNMHLKLRTMQTQLEAQNAQLQQYRERLEQQVAERTAELMDSEQKLRELAAYSEAAREEERKHIARELHDELGQSLTALRMRVSLLRVQFGGNNPKLVAHVGSITELVDRTIQVTRNVASSLRPGALDMGIVSALEWLAEEFAKHSGVHCELHVMEDEIALDENSATAIFRIVQEALTNVARHAQASRVKIALERQGETYVLEVRDDGKGFVPENPRQKSFGLAGVRERVLRLGGEVTLRSAPGQGTALGARIPVQEASQAL